MLVKKAREPSSNALNLKALLSNVEDLNPYAFQIFPLAIFPIHEKAINGAVSFGLFIY